MPFSYLALLATLEEAAPLHKRREQAAVVPAHWGQHLCRYAQIPLCLLATWSKFRNEEAEQK